MKGKTPREFLDGFRRFWKTKELVEQNYVAYLEIDK